MKLKIGSNLQLPDEVLGDVTAILGRRGRGKTTTAVVLVEEAWAAKRRFVVLDPVGVWWGLRSSRDGAHEGIPCIVFGGEHGQVPLEAAAGKTVAEFVADPTQHSAVVDLKLFTKGEQVRFAQDFLQQLYQLNREPLLVVLEEADQFAPQRAMPGEQVMLGVAERLVKLGRARGLGIVLVTQRPATLNKNVLTQSGVLVVHGLTGPQDQAAVLAWIRANADEQKADEVLRSLPGLERGRAWWWAPDLDILHLVDVRNRDTFDSSATPKGGKRAEPRVLAAPNLERLTAEIKAAAERAKENDPRHLKGELQRLRAELAKAQASPSRPVEKLKVETKRVEVAVVKTDQVKRLEAAIAKAGAMVDGDLPGLTKRLEEIIRSAADRVAVAASDLKVALQQARREGEAPRPAGVPLPPLRVLERIEGKRFVPTPPRPAATSNGDLSGPEQRVLDALAELEALGVPQPERVQVAFLADYTNLNSKGFTNAIGSLSSAGRIHYPGTGRVALTPAGRGLAHAIDAPRTSQELQARVVQLLGGVHARVLQPLLQVYPRPLDREDLAGKAGYTNLNSKGFTNAIGRLRSLGFIDYPATGLVAAQPVLFLEG